MKDKYSKAILAAGAALIVGVAIWIVVIIVRGGQRVQVATAADAWESVLKSCAENQAFRPDKMVYLGPSNKTGVGTIWRIVQEGGYELKRLPPDLPPGTIQAGNWSSCTGKSPSSFAVSSGAEGVVVSRLKGGSGALAADLKRAKTVSLKVDAWRQVQLVGDAFSDWVEKLPEDDPYKQSIKRQDRVVAYRVVEVRGMIATLTFDESAAADLRGKYEPEGKAKGAAGLKTEFKGGNTLEIMAPDVFVIEAELGTYSPASGDFKGGFSPLQSDKGAPLTVDLENP